MWKCKKCGSNEFKEIISEAESVGGYWNEDGEHIGYGIEIIATEEIVCCRCGHSERTDDINHIADWVEE